MNQMTAVIYINGVKHNASHIGTSFFADTADLPGRPCSHHTLKPFSVLALSQGQRVFTSGNWYSLQPDKEPST